MTCMASRRIVVGVHGTAASAAAVRWAIREARLRHATVHIIFACRHDGRLRAPYARRSEAPDPVEDDAAARAIFTATAEAARRRLPPGRVKAELTDELPARALVDRTAGAEMLVLGTRQPGRQPAGQPPDAMGPVARACLRHAHCPIVIVAAHDELAMYSFPRTPRMQATARHRAPQRGKLLLAAAAATRAPIPAAKPNLGRESVSPALSADRRELHGMPRGAAADGDGLQ